MASDAPITEPTFVCMVFSEHGNAIHDFDYTPEALEAEALKLRKERGEVSTVTVGPSPFVAGNSSERRQM